MGFCTGLAWYKRPEAALAAWDAAAAGVTDCWAGLPRQNLPGSATREKGICDRSWRRSLACPMNLRLICWELAEGRAVSPGAVCATPLCIQRAAAPLGLPSVDQQLRARARHACLAGPRVSAGSCRLAWAHSLWRCGGARAARPATTGALITCVPHCQPNHLVFVAGPGTAGPLAKVRSSAATRLSARPGRSPSWRRQESCQPRAPSSPCEPRARCSGPAKL